MKKAPIIIKGNVLFDDNTDYSNVEEIGGYLKTKSKYTNKEIKA